MLRKLTAGTTMTKRSRTDVGSTDVTRGGITTDGVTNEDDAVIVKRRPTLRGVLVVGARTTSGLIGVAAAVAVVIAAATLPIPSWSTTAPSMVVTPEAATSRLVCTGAPLRLADDTGADASTASAIATPRTVIAGDGAVSVQPIEQSNAGTGGTDDAPIVLSIDPGADGELRLAAGAQSSLVTSGNVQGLATQTCAAPSGRQWLVAGATTTGRTSLLPVVNPTNVPAVIDLEIVTESGPVSAPGMAAIDVPAGSQRVIPLAGFVLEATSIAVRVTSTGGNVVASLQSSVIRTLEPGGLDVSMPAGEPSTTLMIPGVAIDDGPALAALLDRGTGFEDAITSIRLVAPGEVQAQAQILIVPDGMTAADAVEQARQAPVTEGGEGAASAEVDLTVAAPRLIEVDVPAGRAIDVPVPNMGTGTSSIIVTSTEPVLAAARVTSIGSAGTDFAWLPPVSTLGPESVVAVPGGVAVPTGPAVPNGVAVPIIADARLSIMNPLDSDAEVTIEIDGESSTVSVPATSAISVPVEAGSTVRWLGAAGLVASIVTGGNGMLSVSGVMPPPAASRPVTVYP